MLGFEPRIRASKARVLTTTLYDLVILNLISHTGTRTRVCWVKASYPNRLDYVGINRTHTCNVLSTPCGTRTRNLRFRRPARYPIALMRQTTCIVFPPPWKDLASPWFEQGPFDKKPKVFFYLLFASLKVATVGFDPMTFGLWARHASSAPRCFTPKNIKKLRSNFFPPPPSY